jgi:hypothetical protein
MVLDIPRLDKGQSVNASRLLYWNSIIWSNNNRAAREIQSSKVKESVGKRKGEGKAGERDLWSFDETVTRVVEWKDEGLFSEY